MALLEPSNNSVSSISKDVNDLINLVSEHLSSHPIEDFDLHVAKLLDGNGELDLLDSYKVSLTYIRVLMYASLLNFPNKIVLYNLTLLFQNWKDTLTTGLGETQEFDVR